jgi:predicted ArsR family transcriptional regulator
MEAIMNDKKYPSQPGFRTTAPETSREAAECFAQIASSIRRRVLATVTEAGSTGVTGDEVAASLELHVTQVRSRLSELVAARKITDSGLRRLGASGRRGAVWVLTAYAPNLEAA